MSTAVLVIACSLVAQTDRYGAPASTPSASNNGGNLIYDPSSASSSSSRGYRDPSSQPNRGQSQAPLPTTRPTTGAQENVFGTGGRRTGLPQSSRAQSGVGTQRSPPYRTATTSAPRGTATLPVRAAAESTYKPTRLMRLMLAPPPRSRLTGTPTRLADVIRGAPTREAQSQRINAYWDLCSAVADYYLGLRELEDFQACNSKVTPGNQVWQHAAAALQVRINTSRQAAMAAQYRLFALMGRGDTGSLPLPSDMPHCGDYHTRYAEIFRGRQSSEAALLGQLLPLRYRELQDAAARVKDAQDFLELVTANVSSDYATGVVNALSVLALQRRAFVQIAKDYNRQIVRYSELATPGHLETERLVAMLIKTSDGTSTATRPTSRPTNQSTTPSRYGQQSRAGGVEAPATLAADSVWSPRTAQNTRSEFVDDSVMPASGESRPPLEGEERSVLVQPPRVMQSGSL